MFLHITLRQRDGASPNPRRKNQSALLKPSACTFIKVRKRRVGASACGVEISPRTHGQKAGGSNQFFPREAPSVLFSLSLAPGLSRPSLSARHSGLARKIRRGGRTSYMACVRERVPPAGQARPSISSLRPRLHAPRGRITNLCILSLIALIVVLEALITGRSRRRR